MAGSPTAAVGRAAHPRGLSGRLGALLRSRRSAIPTSPGALTVAASRSRDENGRFPRARDLNPNRLTINQLPGIEPSGRPRGLQVKSTLYPPRDLTRSCRAGEQQVGRRVSEKDPPPKGTGDTNRAASHSGRPQVREGLLLKLFRPSRSHPDGGQLKWSVIGGGRAMARLPPAERATSARTSADVRGKYRPGETWIVSPHENEPFSPIRP